MLISRLNTMFEHGVAFDTETYLLVPGNLTPDLVLGSVAWYDGKQLQGALLTKEQTLELFAQLIEDFDKVICGANIAYDLAIMVREFHKRGVDIIPFIARAMMGEHTEHMTGIHDGRIFDLQHAQALDAIATGMMGKDPRTGAPLVGRYSLDQCVSLVLDRQDAKSNDTYRLRYGEFDGWPLEKLPPEAQQYPVDDAKNTGETTLAQVGLLPKVAPYHTWGPKGACVTCGATGMGAPCWTTARHQNLHDLAAQTATAYWLHMGASYGFRVDQKYVDIIEDYSTKNRNDGLKPFIELGFIRADGTVNQSALKKAMATAYGSVGACEVCKGTGKVPSPANPKSKINCFRMSADGVTKVKTCDGTGLVLHPDVPRSDKDGISVSRSNLVESGEEILMDYAEILEDQKTLTNYVPFLRTGRICVGCSRHGTEKDPHKADCAAPGWKDIPLTLRPNPILETGRVSYDGQLMTLPRKPGYIGKDKSYVPSIRECFRAPDGWVFSSQDFKSGESLTHAQSCIWLLGYSDLGRAILNNVDPHGAIAASVLGVSYEEWVRRKKEPLFKAARQAAKPFSFGKPTGMSSIKLVISNRAQGPDTPAEGGPTWIDDGTNTGNKIRGYKGTRFCILMNGSPTCGEVKVTSWGRREKIPPTCKACLECADHLGKVWLKQWTENQAYYDLNDDIVNNGMEITEEMLERWPHLKQVYAAGQWTEPGQIASHWSGRLRGGMDFTTACNSWFQTLLADIMKLAWRMVARECYDSSIKVPKQMFHNSLVSPYAGAQSPLFGSKPLAPFHDEGFLLHPESMAHDGATRTAEIMRDAFRFVCPDVAPAVGVDETIMKRWYKSAEKVVDENGRLLLWKPKIGPEAELVSK